MGLGVTDNKCGEHGFGSDRTTRQMWCGHSRRTVEGRTAERWHNGWGGQRNEVWGESWLTAYKRIWRSMDYK